MISNYAPPFLVSGDIFKKIYESQQTEIDSINLDIKDLINQLFVNTATWGLSIWEEEFNIKINTFDSYEIRRSRIIAKKKGQGTFTKAFVKNLAESFENGIVEVIEHNSDYYFTIKFTGTKGIPPNLQDLKNVINELKPAHLGVEYEFTFTTWGEVKTITWGSVKTETWGELRTREVI